MAKTLTTSWQLLSSTNTSTYSQLRLYGKYTSQDIVNNTTSITLETRLYGNGGGSNGAYTYAGMFSRLYAQGGLPNSTYEEAETSVAWTKGNETTLLTHSFTITHDANGNATNIQVAGRVYLTASVEGSTSEHINLPQIKRASTPSATPNPANIGSTITINTNRASSNYTHTLTYAFSDLSGTIANDVEDSTTWTIPNSFYAKIPNSATGTCVITCETFNGLTSLGTRTLNLVVRATGNPVVNSISYAATDAKTLQLANSSTLIAYVSDVSFSTNATAQNSSTLASVQLIDGNNILWNTDTTIAGQTTATSTITGSGYFVGTYHARVVDSRGNYTDSSNFSLTFVDYVQLSVDTAATLTRPNQTDDFVVVEEFTGSYWQGNFGQQTNTLTLQYRYKLHSDPDSSYSAWNTIPNANITFDNVNMTYSLTNYQLPSTISHTDVYDIQFQATDKVRTTTTLPTYTIKLGIPNFAVFPEHLYFGNDYIFDATGGTPKLNPSCVVKNVLALNLSSAQSMTGTTDQLIKIDTIDYQIGNKLTFNSTTHKVIIGSGVSHISVSASVVVSSFSTNGLRRLFAKKNGTNFARAFAYYSQQYMNCLVIPPKIIAVAENDEITFSMTNAGNSTVAGSDVDCWFTIEVID